MTRQNARGVLLAGAALLLLTGCGPEQSVSIGVRDVATDILLARPTTAPMAPMAPAVPLPQAPPGFPFVPTPVLQVGDGELVPLPPPLVPQAPPVTACPTAGPLVAALRPAPIRPEAPPQQGQYPVRVDGRFTITGEHAAKGSYPPDGTRRVTDVVGNEDGWGFKLADETGLTTTYVVRPRQAAQEDQPVEYADQPVPTQAGIYVASFDYKRSDGTTLSLVPQPPVMVAKLPFAAGDRWTSRGIDPTSGVSVVVNGQTGLGAKYSPSKARVDACGTVLDAWWVEYTVDTTPLHEATASEEPPSQISGPGITVRFVDSKLAFAPQYGGFPIQEEYVLKGDDGADTVDIRRTAIFSSEPALPQRAP